MIRDWYTLLALLLSTSLLGTPLLSRCASAQSTELFADATPVSSRPHIVVILADDMGWSDIGCYGSEIQTPHLDRLAAQGLRFTQFYNTARCCPTRACLLTGLYPHQAGVGWMMDDNGVDGYRGDLNGRCATFAELLGNSGYQTYMAGKWHVTRHLPPNGSPHNWPTRRGFQNYYGMITGAGSYWDPATLLDQETPVAADVSDADPGLPYHFTDAVANRASGWIRAHDPSKPLLMYVAFTAPHWPMHAHAEDIARYQGVYDQGWDQVRAARHAKQIELGLVDPAWSLTDRDSSVPAWEQEPDQDWQISRMQVYAAMVEQLDRNVGKITNALRERNMLDNTLILFMADNGGCAEEMGSTGAVTPDPSQPFVPEILAPGEPRHIPRPQATRDGRPVRSGHGVQPGPDDSYVAYGQGWANASNTPFRLYKHWVHEGGISSPLIVHWPAGLTRVGELESQPAHLVDIMPTLLELAAVEYPTSFTDRALTPLEGTSLAPLFRSQPIERGPIFWEHEGNRAVRLGDWKLVAKGADGEWELYNLRNDRTELHDVSQSMPERVAELRALWEAWAERADVLPLVPYRASEGNRRKTRFEFSNGDALDQRQSPNTTAADLQIQGSVEYDGSDGVILAHGGSSHGYALYVLDGKLEIAIRRNEKLTRLTAPHQLAQPSFSLSLVYPRSGPITLSVDGVSAELGPSPGPLAQHPQDGLDVGFDRGGRVGPYEFSESWSGEIELTLELVR